MPDPKPSAEKEISGPSPANEPPREIISAGTEAPKKPLTPEEQMAAFEQDLKENDWGHQPC